MKNKLYAAVLLGVSVLSGTTALHAASGSPSAPQAETQSASLAGNWQLSFTAPSGDQRQAVLQIQQSGSTLSGKFQGMRGSGALSGSVQGSQVSLTVKGHGREISFSGTVDGNKMSGTDAQGSPWSATRQ